MRTRVLALGLLCAASLCAQRRFNWQNYCFDHPAAPFCSGNDYAIKQPPKNAPRDSVTSPLPATLANGTPSDSAGGIDWRFADPSPDVLVGFNVRRLSTSTLARSLMVKLGASQNLTDADMQKIFDGLAGIDQAALSIHDDRIVFMLAGRVADSTFTGLGQSWKATQISESAILVGHADAVDQALQRLAIKTQPAAFARLAAERQADSDLWAVGSSALVAPQAVSAGAKRFSLAVSIRNRLTSDLAFDFDGPPSSDTRRTWQSLLGVDTLEGDTVHVNMSMEAGETEQKFGQIAASPIGQRLAALVKVARYLPVHVTAVPNPTKPVIYGLDNGPKEVKQYPKR
jgi:hypothetical protein